MKDSGRFFSSTLILLALAGGSSCSYQEKHKTETLVEQSVERFHDAFNNEQYHEIYSQSDRELRGRISEAGFTEQLRTAHEQLGKTSGKAFVFIDDSIWRGLRRAFGTRREMVFHADSPASDLIIANERFGWAV